MRKVSDTIARLAKLRRLQNTHPPSFAPAGRLSTLGKFGSNPGALLARYYLPADLPDAAPLVVVLHGCTQSPAGYDHHSGWSQLADKAGFALLYPEQQRANNPNLCFNWFLPADTARDRGEVLSIRQMIETMLVTHGLDRKRVFVTGLSAGGAMAAAMLATYPDVFAGGGIIAGLPFGCATTVPEAFDRMRGHGGPSEQELQRLVQGASKHNGQWPRISIWQGSGDHTVASANAECIAAQWRAVHKLDKAPTYSTSERGRSRQIWADGVGEAKIEINMIAGMGHGTPIGNGLGTAGPYMLDVGISSTREMARFWGLGNAGDTRGSVRARSALPTINVSSDSLRGAGEGQTAETARSDGELSQGGAVKKVIEDALRAAGLMRWEARKPSMPSRTGRRSGRSKPRNAVGFAIVDDCQRVSNMNLIQILLPRADNAGQPFARDDFDRVKEELAADFEGVTAFLQAPAEGLWREGGQTDNDDIVIFEVMAEEIDLQDWRRRRTELERRFRQDKVIIRYMPMALV